MSFCVLFKGGRRISDFKSLEFFGFFASPCILLDAVRCGVLLRMATRGPLVIATQPTKGEDGGIG